MTDKIGFKKWMALNESDLRKVDDIPAEKLMDFARANLGDGEKRVTNTIALVTRFKQSLRLLDILKILLGQGGGPAGVFTYDDYTGFKGRNRDLDKKWEEVIVPGYREHARKLSDKITEHHDDNMIANYWHYVFRKNYLRGSFPEHDYFSGKESNRKVYVNMMPDEKNFLQAVKDFMDYFVENAMLFRQCKVLAKPDRKETFIFYLSTDGERALPKIDSDVASILARNGVKHEGWATESLIDNESAGSGNQIRSAGNSMRSILPLLGKEYARKLIDLLKQQVSSKDVWADESSQVLQRARLHKPLVRDLASMGISLDDNKGDNKGESKDGKTQLGRVRCYLVNGVLSLRGQKAQVDIRLQPNQEAALASVKLENVMGSVPPPFVDLSKSARSVRIDNDSVKHLGVADAVLDGHILKLGKATVFLSPNQLQSIKGSLGLK